MMNFATRRGQRERKEEKDEHHGVSISQLSQPAKAAKHPGLLFASLTRDIVSSQFTLLMLISSRSRLPVDVSFNADSVERIQ